MVSDDDDVVATADSLASPTSSVKGAPGVDVALKNGAIDEADVVVLDGRSHDRHLHPPDRAARDLDGIRQRRPTVALLWLRRLGDEARLPSLLDAFDGHRGPFDVLLDPFQPLEFKVRVQLLVQRLDGRSDIAFGTFVIDAKERTVRTNGRTQMLPRREFDLLWLLASHPGRVFEREEIIRRVWGDDYDGTERTVDVRVAHLRTVLGTRGRRGTPIETVRGVGYRFNDAKVT